MIVSGIFKSKEPRIETVKCKIEEVVTLSAEEYAVFENNLLQNYDFIREKKDLMYREANGVSHCLLVVGENSEDGIIVEAEGFPYPRYTSVFPKANEYIRLKISEIVESIVEEGTQETDDGTYLFPFEELNEKFKFDVMCVKEKFKEALESRDEVADVDMLQHSVRADFHFEYCSNLKEDIQNGIAPNM